MKTTLYQLHLTGRLKHMVIEVNGNQIITEWWTSKDDEDAKRQNTKETVYGKNQGRSNETSDEEQAILEFERKVKKKKEEGYVENKEDAIIEFERKVKKKKEEGYVEKNLILNKIASRIYERLDEIENIKEYNSLLEEEFKGWRIPIKKPEESHVAFQILTLIHNRANLADSGSSSEAEEKLRIFLQKINPSVFSFESYSLVSLSDAFQKTVHAAIKNMIMGGRGNIKFEIDSHEELELVVSMYKSVGLRIFIEDYEVGKKAWKKPGLVSTVETSLERDDITIESHPEEFTRVAEILGKWARHSPVLKKLVGSVAKHKTSKEIKQIIVKRASRPRKTSKGIFARDHELAFWLKVYYDYDCFACEDSKEIVELSHKIPLSLGLKKYAFDHPLNMEPLCHKCHKRYEKKFDESYRSLDESGKKNKVRKMHEEQLANSEWTPFFNIDNYK